MKNIVATIVLVVIAINLTYTNITNLEASINASAKQEAKVENKVVKVLGRVSSVFDGLGAENGFLVKNGDKMEIIHCDQGSMASQPGWKPQYLNVVTFADGRTVMNPVTVETFN
jgi:hypothetical protein